MLKSEFRCNSDLNTRLTSRPNAWRERSITDRRIVVERRESAEARQLQAGTDRLEGRRRTPIVNGTIANPALSSLLLMDEHAP
jgi:hypothetical protein